MKKMNGLEVLFTPADFEALRQTDLTDTICVVFDILRATSSMVTALVHGAEAILPVAEIEEAVGLWRKHPDVLLAGERDGLRIRGDRSGGVEFHLGNSPREFVPERVSGRTIVMTTTNGTRALRACQHAGTVLIGSFLNLGGVARYLQARPGMRTILVCSGTIEAAALEDTLAAGALCARLETMVAGISFSDSAIMARRVYQGSAGDLARGLGEGRNGRRLLALAGLAEDVAFCAQADTTPRVARMCDGAVRLVPESEGMGAEGG